jgi:hypothetical protein
MTQATDDILASLAHYMAQQDGEIERQKQIYAELLKEAQETTLEAIEDKSRAENALEETRARLDAMIVRVITFAGQLSAWGFEEGAAELMTEILQGPVTTDQAYATLRADLLACRAAALGLVAEWRKRGRELDELRATDTRLVNQMQHLEFERDQADAYAADVEATNRRLTAELTTLRTLARTVCDSAARELNYSADVLLVSTTALRQLEKAVRDETTR